MKLEHVQNVLTSLMVLSFLIFAGMLAMIQFNDISLTPRTLSLPFAFLFVFIMTLIISGQISEQPNMIRKFLIQWLSICVLIIFLSSILCIFGW